MSTSPARIAANRRNAQQSTGPQTAAGKARSRLNAFQHGLAGRGDVLGPREDAKVVAERTLSFVRELDAVGASGHVLAHRAAVLSVRLDRVAEAEAVAVRIAEREARAAFDADRNDAIAELFAAADDSATDPNEALAALAESPDGLHALLGAWRDLLADLRSAHGDEARQRAARWLGRAAADDPAALIPPVETEIKRLQQLTATTSAACRALDQARDEAGLLARLDPGPTVALARRYEAAAERGLHRAFTAIATINRQSGRAQPATHHAPPPASPPLPVPSFLRDRPAATPPTSAPRTTPPRDPLASFGAPPAEPLASFRVGVAPAPAPPDRSAILDPSALEPRRNRPDINKINRQLAANRR